MARPRKTSSTLEQSGEFAKRPSRARKDPQPGKGFPVPPSIIKTPRQKKIWRETCGWMADINQEALCDQASLAAYVLLYDRMQTIQARIDKDGLFDKKGKINPAFTSLRGVIKEMLPFIDRFGLSPVSRTKLAVPVLPDEKETPAEALIAKFKAG